MKTGLSIKNETKRAWKRYYFSKKLYKVFGELSLFERIRFVLTGKVSKPSQPS